jgi:hypothetical protein
MATIHHHEAIRDHDLTTSIIYSTFSAIIENITGIVKESDIALQQAFGKDWNCDAGVDHDEQFDN